MRKVKRLLAPVLCGTLLMGAPAGAQLTSPRPDVYDMSDVRGDWFRGDEAAAQGRDIWFLAGSGSAALFTQCEIRVAPMAGFAAGAFVDYVMAMSRDEYVGFLSSAFPDMTAVSARERLDVDGLSALTHTIEAVLNGAPTTWLHVMTYRSGQVVMTMCGTPSSGFSGVRPAFEDFIDQLRFSPDVASADAASADAAGAASTDSVTSAAPTGSATGPATTVAAADAADARCDRGAIDGRLSVAINGGCRALVSELIANGADPNEPTAQGYLPLVLAAGVDNADMVRLLVAAGADVDASTDSAGSALESAAMEGYETVTRVLLELGADPNVADDAGATPVYSAAAFGEEAIVRLLLEAGADPGTSAYAGQTPLIVAARGGYHTVVRLLLEAGADVEARTLAGETALDLATSDAVRALLLDAGARQ